MGAEFIRAGDAVMINGAIGEHEARLPWRGAHTGSRQGSERLRRFGRADSATA